MQEGLLVTVAGMGIVFAALGALLLVMLLLSRFLSPKEKEEDKEQE